MARPIRIISIEVKHGGQEVVVYMTDRVITVHANDKTEYVVAMNRHNSTRDTELLMKRAPR